MGISETINKLEDIRQKIIICSCVMGIIILIFFVSMLSGSAVTYGFGVFIIAVFAELALAVIVHKLNRSYKEMYKKTFLTAVLSENLDDVVYRWDVGFTARQVKDFGISQMGNRFSSEDYLSASYKGIHFEQSDVDIKYHSGGKNSHTTTYFKGRMFAFDFPQKRAISIQAFSNNFIYRGKPAEGFRMKKIQFEDIDFNKQFDVTSVDEHEAFYVLTPPLMEKMKYIKNQFGNLAIHFTRGKMYVAFNSSRDAFDPVVTKKIDYMEEKARMQQDVQVIKDIIDVLIQ